MSLGQRVIDVIERRRDRQRKNQPGAVGKFWRDGGHQLLYNLPVKTGGLIIDVGGYQGEWSAGMISRFGCRSLIFEPVPAFFNHCLSFFKNNAMVEVHNAALGGSNRKTIFSFLDNGTSEYNDDNSLSFESDVVDIAEIIAGESLSVDCIKLNIEGGEYEVLERMIETNKVACCKSLLIQFHKQPVGYESRYKAIVTALEKTHIQNWSYEMVWEKWTLKNI